VGKVLDETTYHLDDLRVRNSSSAVDGMKAPTRDAICTFGSASSPLTIERLDIVSVNSIAI